MDRTDYVLIPLLMMAKMQKIICCYEGKFLLPVIPDLPFLMFSILKKVFPVVFYLYKINTNTYQHISTIYN